jgi:SAM-dependent methyltransferase
MRERLLTFLCCPACHDEHLELTAFTREGDHVMEGAIRCTGCQSFYLVVRGVPRMLPRDLYADDAFTTRWRERLTALGWRPPADFIAGFKDLKQATSTVYGFEWNNWNRHGWTPDAVPSAMERDRFHHKSLLSAEELRGKLVVDGGCGNGRYAYTAAQLAGDVIALDLSAAVDASFVNLRPLPSAHVVMGDIMNPPIRRGTVDAVFSIGVLMITGDARRATESLATLVKPGGTITVHVYAAGFPLWQFNDTWVRAITTRLSVPANVKLARVMSRVARWLDARRWLGYSSLLLRVWPEDAVNFDWYATPKQTYHSYDEVKGWFRDLGFAIVATNERPPHAEPPRTLRKRVGRWVWREMMLTVRGRKPRQAQEDERPAA